MVSLAGSAKDRDGASAPTKDFDYLASELSGVMDDSFNFSASSHYRRVPPSALGDQVSWICPRGWEHLDGAHAK
jgi:hypothetical protein